MICLFAINSDINQLITQVNYFKSKKYIMAHFFQPKKFFVYCKWIILHFPQFLKKFCSFSLKISLNFLQKYPYQSPSKLTSNFPKKNIPQNYISVSFKNFPQKYPLIFCKNLPQFPWNITHKNIPQPSLEISLKKCPWIFSKISI